MSGALPDSKILAVGGRFILYFLIFDVLVMLATIRGLTKSLQLATTSVSTSLINATGQQATVSGTLIALPNRMLAVDLACTAIFIVGMYGALVLAYPVKWRLRLLGLAIGIPVIVVVNVLRIVVAGHISVAAPDAFSFVHDYLFQVGMVLLVAAMWAAWLAYGRRHA